MDVSELFFEIDDLPSHNTLNRVFRRLEPTQLEALCTNWGKDIVGLLAQKQLIVDGKQLRGTVEAGHKHLLKRLDITGSVVSIDAIGLSVDR